MSERLPEDELTYYTGDACISCTSCMSNCPVMEATQDYDGPKLVAPAHGRMHFSEEDIERSLELCSNCKTCDRSCPNGVSVSTLNLLQKGVYYRTHKHPMRDLMISRPEPLAKLITGLPMGASLANMGIKVANSLGMLSMMGLAGKRTMPAYTNKTFLSRMKSIKQPKSDKKIVFYVGCSINYNTPEIGEAFVKVMNHNGYEVLVDPAFVCCGSPLIVTGYLDAARKNVDTNVDRLLYWKQEGIPVVSCCTSCSYALRKEYEELYGEKQMKEAGSNVYDAFEFLEMLDAKGQLKIDFKEESIRFMYHQPCHLKSAGIGTPAAQVLKHVPGVAVELADAGCCGICGNYGYRKERYDVSMKVGEQLFKRILSSQPDSVICDCPTCRQQIEHGTHKEAIHPIMVLARNYKYE